MLSAFPVIVLIDEDFIHIQCSLLALVMKPKERLGKVYGCEERLANIGFDYHRILD